MGRWDQMFERQCALVQAEVPEPCVAIGALQPAGTWGSFGLANLSPAAGMFKQHKANQTAGALSGRHGLHPNHITYLAVTADRFYAFDAKPRRTSIKIVGKLVEWDRKDVSCEVVPGKMATRVVIEHADGGRCELEGSNVGRYNDPLYAALSEMAPR